MFLPKQVNLKSISSNNCQIKIVENACISYLPATSLAYYLYTCSHASYYLTELDPWTIFSIKKENSI